MSGAELGWLWNVLQDCQDIEEVIQDEIDTEMKRAVKKNEEANHSSGLDQNVLARDLAQRADGQSDQKQA